MNPIAGRPPPTYKFGPDPEFWRSFTRSTQPSTDDAASDPGRRLRGQKLTCSGRCVTFGASANSTKAPKRILADQLLSARVMLVKEARIVRGAALKEFHDTGLSLARVQAYCG